MSDVGWRIGKTEDRGQRSEKSNGMWECWGDREKEIVDLRSRIGKKIQDTRFKIQEENSKCEKNGEQ